MSYGDMLLQGRAASGLPGQAAARLAEMVGVRLGAPDTGTVSAYRAITAGQGAGR